MRLKVYILIFVLLAGVSCRKKNYPESVNENEPMFYFKGTVNNKPIQMQAGVNGYQMYSSFKQDSNFIYSLMGTLKKFDCESNCANSIEIKINDYQELPLNAPVNINGAVSVRAYNYLVPTQNFQFQSLFNKTASSYHWDFGDGQIASVANPPHIFQKPGNYNVCLRINSNNGCTSSICNVVKVGYPDKSFMATITATVATDSAVSFAPLVTGGVAPFRYFWTFGDGASSEAASVNHAYQFPGAYPVSLKVIDATNDTAFTRYNVVTKSDASSCATNYRISSIINEPLVQLPLSKIVIKWVDENGVEYRSNGFLQPTSSYFQVMEVEDFEANENGDRTKRVRINFQCDVFNGTNKLTLKNAEAIITIAYK